MFRNKAVSDGALSYYHDHFVNIRVSKFTYGSFCSTAFDPVDPDHERRRHSVRKDVDGTLRIPGSFAVILPKVCLFSSMIVSACQPFYAEYTSFGDPGIQTVFFQIKTA